MGRQWNQIIESLGPLSGGTGLSINANLTEIEALLTTLQADIVDGIIVSSGSSVVTNGTLAQLTNGTVAVGNNNFEIKTVIAQDGSSFFVAPNGGSFRIYTPTGATKTLNNIFGATPSWIVAFSDSITWVSDSGTDVAYFHDGTQWTLDDLTTPAGSITLNGSVFIANLSATSDVNLLNGFRASQLNSPVVENGALRVGLANRGTTTVGTLTAGTTNGTLFGSNATRNYLLVQCTSGTAFIDTNGTASTTTGIQLTSGQGITFEGSFIPTGAITAITSTGTARLIGRQG